MLGWYTLNAFLVTPATGFQRSVLKNCYMGLYIQGQQTVPEAGRESIIALLGYHLSLIHGISTH